MNLDAPVIAEVVQRTLSRRYDPADVLVNFRNTTAPAVLESTLTENGYGRYSIFACAPAASVTMSSRPAGSPFGSLAAQFHSIAPVQTRAQLPFFHGGWLGYITYEVGSWVEPSVGQPRFDTRFPPARFHLYDTVAVFDRKVGQWHLTAIEWPSGIMTARSRADVRLEALQALVTRPPRAGRRQGNSTMPAPVEPSLPREAYLKNVRAIKDYIEAGDVYEVNLSKRFSARSCADPWSLYAGLRESNPSAHAAFLPWDDVGIICCSPELFLKVTNRHVITRPIKGTRPKCGDPQENALRRADLRNHPKDTAELNMIVDLQRNDLGRVCRVGSVRVTDPCTIEDLPTVLHRVATIEGELRADCNWAELLDASFPGGSVTGAPKIRAMQIIDELEPVPRGVYCGSIGHIGFDGNMEFNIAIRTMTQVGDRLDIHAGGAIVSDSDPEAEYEEVLAKAAALIRATGHDDPSTWDVSGQVDEFMVSA
jgi:para-aminobenzoate synthetase component 1